MSAHVLFNLLNYFELAKKDKMRDLSSNLSSVLQGV